MNSIRHQSLEYPGLWTLSYFGKLLYPPYIRTQPKVIRGFLYPLAKDQEQALRYGKPTGIPKICYFPVGELARLRHGIVLDNGVPISNPYGKFDYETPVISDIDFDEWNVQVIEKNKTVDGKRLIRDIRNHGANNVLEDENSLYLAIGEGGNPYRYIIPCTEIFRFFYATSSTIANFTFSDKILSPDKYLWNMKASNLCTKTGNALIWLRKYMLDADARFLARFAWDKFALDRLQEIYLYAAASTGKYIYPKMVYARPPILGVHKTSFLGFEGNNSVNSFFITRLISCEVPMLFNYLMWDRDNDGRSNPDGSSIPQNPKKRNNYNLPKPIKTLPKLLVDKKPNKNLSPYRISENEISERFPNLIDIPAEKLPQTVTQKFEATGDVKSLFRESFIGGSVVDGFSSASMIGPAAIAAELPNDRGSLKAQNVDPRCGSTDHISVLNHLILANNEDIASVEFLVVTSETVTYENCPLNVMSVGIEPKVKPTSWIYLDDKKNCRCVIIARIQANFENEKGIKTSKVRYLIEVQPKKSGEFSTVVLWRNNEQIELGIFDVILEDMIEHKQVKVFNENVYGIEWGRLKHTTGFTGNIKDTFHFIKRLFDKTAELDKKLDNE